MDVELIATCTAADEWLQLEYTLINRGDTAILAYDGAPGVPPDAEWPDLTTQIYVSAGTDAVALKRVNPPPLPDVDMGRAFIPPVAETPPRRQRRVRFRMKTPLVERSQYTPDFAGAQYEQQLVHRVELWIGYFVKPAGIELIPFPGNPDAFRVKGAHGPQQFAKATVDQTVDVKVRTDPQFHRI